MYYRRINEAAVRNTQTSNMSERECTRGIQGENQRVTVIALSVLSQFFVAFSAMKYCTDSSLEAVRP